MKKLIVSLVIIIIAILGIFFVSKMNKDTQNKPTLTDIDEALKSYSNSKFKFFVKYPVYPASFSINEKYVYQALGPGKDIKGISFIIPSVLVQGTNLSSDSYVSIETLDKLKCSINDFIEPIQSTSTVSINEEVYLVASTTDAAAGNRYEEVLTYMNNCQAIRFFIHSTNIQNYPDGAVKEFNREEILGLFNEIRSSYRKQ